MAIRLPSTLVVVLLMACTSMMHAQPDELTDEFAKLSAKERARIAREEQEKAANDMVYQGLMTTAEVLFRTQDYDGALVKYQEARKLRPYNVYPKVKIQDLQQLIAKRDGDSAAAQPEVAMPPEIVAVPPTAEPPAPVPTTEAAASTPPAPEPRPEPTPVVVPPKTEPAVDRVIQPAARRTELQPPAPPIDAPRLEEGERIYKEGRSVVVETRVAEDGRIVLYRKVSHPWGEEFHFREGLAISERSYKESLGK